MRRGRQQSCCRRIPLLHAHGVWNLCAPFLTHPACRRLPACLLSALRLCLTACGISPLVLVAAVGLRLDVVVVVVPVARVAISGVPDVGVGMLEPPGVSAWRRAASATSSQSPLHWGESEGLQGGFGGSWVSRSRRSGILGVAVALLRLCALSVVC
jgi:hypothetical protein